jgi:hypothetical protein
MKKLIINALGIGCVFTLITMVVMVVCFTDKDDSRIKDNVSGKGPASMRSRIDHFSDNIKPQNVVARNDTYSSSSNLSNVYESYISDSSETYDPTDYPEGDSFDTGNARNVNSIDSYNEIKAAEIIE